MTTAVLLVSGAVVIIIGWALWASTKWKGRKWR